MSAVICHIAKPYGLAAIQASCSSESEIPRYAQASSLLATLLSFVAIYIIYFLKYIINLKSIFLSLLSLNKVLRYKYGDVFIPLKSSPNCRAIFLSFFRFLHPLRCNFYNRIKRIHDKFVVKKTFP